MAVIIRGHSRCAICHDSDLDRPFIATSGNAFPPTDALWNFGLLHAAEAVMAQAQPWLMRARYSAIEPRLTPLRASPAATRTGEEHPRFSHHLDVAARNRLVDLGQEAVGDPGVGLREGLLNGTGVPIIHHFELLSTYVSQGRTRLPAAALGTVAPHPNEPGIHHLHGELCWMVEERRVPNWA